MSAEAWPTEAAATAAVDAAARASYEHAVAERQKFQPHAALPSWDDLHAVAKLEIRNQILVPVWAALEALPDPRHAAFEEGYAAGRKHSTDGNPYPSGL